MAENLPDFLVLGTQKGGTTTLQQLPEKQQEAIAAMTNHKPRPEPFTLQSSQSSDHTLAIQHSFLTAREIGMDA